MYEFAGLHIYAGSIKNIISLINVRIRKGKHGYICFLGSHGVVESQNNGLVKTALNKASLVVPDGMSVVWIGKLLGQYETERIYGPDTMLATCRLAQDHGYRIFLYGATDETLKKLKTQLRLLYPKLRITGVHAPPFRPLTKEEKTRIYKKINQSKAQLVFVGLSTPKQELWMQESVSKLHANVLCGVGAAFDFVAGTKAQAPVWMRGFGLEWFFRLLHEPRRLWYRYTVMNIEFLWVTVKHLMKLW